MLIYACGKEHRTVLLHNSFANRQKSLSTKQEELLTSFSAFMDAHLFPSTQERRSVAFYLCGQLAQRVPPELLPVALSRDAVKSLLSSRRNKKNTLYNLAGVTLDELVAAAGTYLTSPHLTSPHLHISRALRRILLILYHT